MKYGLALALVMLSASTFAADEPAAQPKADPAKGQQIVTQVCAACHGADGNSASPAYPSLAGQSAGYISAQLAYFKDGTRKNPIMAGFAASLSADDMSSVGAYFEKQTPKPQAAKSKELAQQGEKLYRGGNAAKAVPACTACHLANGAGIPRQYPRLAGQHTDYTLTQLKAFASGERNKGNAGVMAGIAERLSEADMKSVAEYIAGLR